MNAKILLLCIGVSSVTLFLHSIINDQNQSNTVTVSIKNKKVMEEVAFIGYTYKCSSCGDDKAEGYKSFVDGYHYEACNACDKYTELGGSDNDK